jgi:glyoxylase-like metal-dependent hydrolase (beta-lactamase superfamily II)
VAPEDVTDIVLSHAHFDHMGSIHRFPRARLHIQASELLSWHEAMALPARFGYLTAIINPDDLRAMFDASVEHRVTASVARPTSLVTAATASMCRSTTPWAAAGTS